MKYALSSVAVVCVVLFAAGMVMAQPVKPANEIEQELGGGRTVRGASAGASVPGATVDLQVQFAYNSATLTPQAEAQLEELAKALTAPSLASDRFRIEGHTDSDGSAAYNQALSERRAAAAKRFLVEHGVDASHLQVRGFGESRLIADESTPDGKDRNRRVAVVNLGKVDDSVTSKEKPAEAIPSSASGAAEKPARKPRVDVVVQYERNGQKDRVRPGTVLLPVDNYNVSFTPATRSFVYVLQFDADGNVSTVFPNKEHSATVNPLVPHRSYVVPSEGRWLRIKGTPGEEEIVVLASGQEIDDPAGIAQALRRTKRGVEPDPVKDSVTMPADLFSYRLPYTTKLP